MQERLPRGQCVSGLRPGRVGMRLTRGDGGLRTAVQDGSLGDAEQHRRDYGCAGVFVGEAEVCTDEFADLVAIDLLDSVGGFSRLEVESGTNLAFSVGRADRDTNADVCKAAQPTLTMDARPMSASARYGLVFGRLGITPEANST